MRVWTTLAPSLELLLRQRSPAVSITCAGSPATSSIEHSRCSLQRRSRVARAIAGSAQTTFISVSLKRECSLRFAEPIVSQRSSTIPIFAWT
jgi:hypothetical protein